jgi:hypothetical protein
MEQLNEFRVLCQDSLLRTIANLRRELRSYREREKRLVFEDIGDGTDDAIMGLEDIEIPTWEDSERFLVRFNGKKPQDSVLNFRTTWEGDCERQNAGRYYQRGIDACPQKT